MTLAEMAERSAIGASGVCCVKCGCRDFRTYKTIQHNASTFRYKLCRHCGTKILTTSQTNERVIREVDLHVDNQNEDEFDGDIL